MFADMFVLSSECRGKLFRQCADDVRDRTNVARNYGKMGMCEVDLSIFVRLVVVSRW